MKWRRMSRMTSMSIISLSESAELDVIPSELDSNEESKMVTKYMPSWQFPSSLSTLCDW